MSAAHHYTNGLGFTLQGTPTNNTPDGASGFAAADPDGGGAMPPSVRPCRIREVERRRC